MGNGGAVEGQVRRLRLSYIASRIHDRMREIGEPNAFAELLMTPTPVRGLQVSRPFAPDLPVELRFWGDLAERRLRDNLDEGTAKRLRRAGTPLRYRGELEAAGVHTPRFEAHLLPYGLVAISTFDLIADEGIPFSDLSSWVEGAAAGSATVSVGANRFDTSLGSAAETAADALFEVFRGDGGQSWAPDSYCIHTLLDLDREEGSAGMPALESATHRAVHNLSGGGGVLTNPPAFVAQWSGAEFVWSAARLEYMIDAGTSLLSDQDLEGASENARGDAHRWLTLLMAHVTSSLGLVRAAPESDNAYFDDWAKTAASRLGRLYGPATPSQLWGLETRTYLQISGGDTAVTDLTGEELHEKYPVPPYP